MAVSSVRTHHTETASTIEQYGTITFNATGTPTSYVTGGVPFNTSTIGGSFGSTPITGTVLWFSAASPTGYTYALVGSGASGKLKILNGTTELANAAAFPDATVPFRLETRKGL